MDADVEPRPVAQQLDGVRRGRGRSATTLHGGDDPLVVGLRGPAGHAGVEADVVGRDDEGLQAARAGAAASGGSGRRVPPAPASPPGLAHLGVEGRPARGRS